MDLRVIGMAAALGSAASWAVGSILFKRLGERISPVAMTLAKGVVSIVLLALLMLIWPGEALAWQPLLLLIVSGLLGIALGDTFFFAALQDLGPQALAILLMLGQVITVILAVLFLGEKPTSTVWLGIFLVIYGIGVVIWPKLSEGKEESGLRGVILGLLSVLCMSVSFIIAKTALDSVSALQATFIRMFAGTLGMLIFGAFTRQVSGWMTPFRDRKLVGHFIISVCVITYGGFLLSFVAFKYVELSIANTLNSTEPIFILPLSAIFLKEPITARAILGTAITMGGIVLLCQAQ